MAKQKGKSTSQASHQQVFKSLAVLLKRTAKAMTKKHTLVDQLSELSQHFNDQQAYLDEHHSAATATWLQAISEDACVIGELINVFDKKNIDMEHLRLDLVDGLVAAVEGLSQTLQSGASSLNNACGFAEDEDHGDEIRQELEPVKRQMTQLAQDLFSTSFGIRVFTGLDPDNEAGLQIAVNHCRCCPVEHVADPKLELMALDLEYGIYSDLNGQGDDLRRYLELIKSDLETLKELILMLASLMLWLSSQPFLASNAGPWIACDDECTPSNNLVGARVTKVTAVSVGGSIINYQPQCYVDWDYCCTNWCVLAFWENFIKTVQTGPHNLGGQIRLVRGQSARVAQTVANRRARAVRPSTAYTAPGKPSC